MNKKRKKGSGTLRKRADGRWEARVVIGYDEKGLPITKCVTALEKTKCLEKFEKLKEEINLIQRDTVKSDMPFGEWLDFWYRHYCHDHTAVDSGKLRKPHLQAYYPSNR